MASTTIEMLTQLATAAYGTRDYSGLSAIAHAYRRDYLRPSARTALEQLSPTEVCALGTYLSEHCGGRREMEREMNERAVIFGDLII